MSNESIERAIGRVEGTVDGLQNDVRDIRADQKELRREMQVAFASLEGKIDGNARTEADAYNTLRTKVATIAVTVSILVGIGGFFLRDWASDALAMITP